MTTPAPNARSCVAAVLLALCCTASAESAPKDYEARSKIPGHYTIGVYADRQGQSTKITVGAGEQSFDCFLGVTSDSMRVFSGLVFRLELPPGASLEGPIVWAPVEGLEQKESATGGGTLVEFNTTCISQVTDAPAIVGRMRVRMNASLGDFEVTPGPHRIFGLSVELCDDANAWPKPFADPIALEVSRKKGFWQRIRSFFGG